MAIPIEVLEDLIGFLKDREGDIASSIDDLGQLKDVFYTVIGRDPKE